MNYRGQCYCGATHFEVKGEPLFTQYCHCNKCRLVASNSKNPDDKIGYGFTAAYLTENLKITQGAGRIDGACSK